jgi:hypothetical protein
MSALRRALAGLAGLVFVLSAPAQARAQAVPIVQAGADGRYERQIDPKVVVSGFTAEQVRRFRARMDAILAQLSAMPSVTEPPAPACHRLKSWLELKPPHGAMSAEIDVMSPVSLERGRCHRITGGGVIIFLNRADALLDASQATVRGAEDGAHDWYVLRPVQMTPTRLELDDGSIAFTHASRPLMRPVSAERFVRERIKQGGEGAEARGSEGDLLERWSREERPGIVAQNAAMLRAMAAGGMPAAKLEETRQLQEDVLRSTEQNLAERSRAAATMPRPWTDALTRLSPAARAAQACFAANLLTLDPSPACRADRRIWELNPDYFDKLQPASIQLLVLSTPKGRYQGESDVRLAARMAVWRDLDRPALAAMVR